VKTFRTNALNEDEEKTYSLDSRTESKASKKFPKTDNIMLKYNATLIIRIDRFTNTDRDRKIFMISETHLAMHLLIENNS